MPGGGALYVETKTSRPAVKWLAWLAVLTGIFSFGAAGGLFVSAWLKHHPHYADTARVVIPGVEIPARASVPFVEDDLVDKDIDVRPSVPEPEMKSETPKPEATAPAPEAPPQPPAVAEIENIQKQPEPPRQEAMPQEARQEVATEPPKREEPPAMTSAQEAKQEAKQEAPAAMETISPSTASAVPAPSPKAAKKVRPKPKVAKKSPQDHEIDRIKRQAGDELMKKTAGRNAAQREQKGTVTVSARPLNRRTLLVQCERAPNIFQRERCKWNLCNGMWGKNGCPSYEKPRELY